MENMERVIQLIFNAVDEINKQLKKKQRVIKNINTILFGRHGQLDSLGLVNLIVTVEKKLVEEYGITIILADERAMAQNKNPFKTIGSLANYVYTLIKEKLNE